MQTIEVLLLLAQVHCTVNFMLHPGGGARNHLNYAVTQIAQLREMGLCKRNASRTVLLTLISCGTLSAPEPRIVIEFRQK